MSGGLKYHYPKWVWSPAGGWWPKVKNANRNAGIYITAVGMICYLIAEYAKPKMVVYKPNILPIESHDDEHHH